MGIGAALFLGVSVASRLLALLSLAVLGRLLAPEAFGLVAYAAAAAALLTAAIDLHFDQSIVREAEIRQARIDTVFTLRLLFAGLIAAGLLAAAAPLAAWLEAPALEPVLRAMCVLALASGLFNPRFVLLERDLAFGRVAAVEVGAQLASTVLAIGLAWITRSHWAAVAGMIAASFARTALSWTLVRGPVRLGLAEWRDCLRFSAWLVAMGLLTVANGQANRIITGAVLGLAVLGRFRLGAELALSAVYFVQRPMTRVAYPGLAAARAQGRGLGEAFLRFQGVLMLAIVPTAVSVCVAAPWIVRVLVGEPWAEAVLALRVLALLPIVQCLTAGTNSLMLVDGRTWLSFGRQAVVFALSVPLLWLGGRQAGLAGILAATAATAAISVALTLALLLPVAGLSPRRFLAAVWPALAGGAAGLAAGALVAASLPDAASLGLAGALAAGGAAGGAAGAACLAVVGAVWWAAGRPEGAEAVLVEGAGALWRRARRRGGRGRGTGG